MLFVINLFLAITVTCLNYIYKIQIESMIIQRKTYIYMCVSYVELSYFQFEFYLLTCYTDGMLERKCPFKNNKVLSYPHLIFRKPRRLCGRGVNDVISQPFSELLFCV